MKNREEVLIVSVKMLKIPAISIEELTKNTIKELKKRKFSFDFLELIHRQTNKFGMILDYIKNTITILLKARKYKKIYFTVPVIYIYPIGLFFGNKKIYTCVHHVDNPEKLDIRWKLMLKYAGTMIAVSEFTKNQLLSLGYKNIYINYNGISREFFPKKIKKFRDFQYILFIGNEALRKNLNTLFKAFKIVIKKYPNLKLIKIGPASDFEIENTNNYIKQLKIIDNVVLIRERKKTQELRKYYSNAICYISVSTLEGFGLTIPEAMSCGCPVIASNIPPVKEIINNSQITVKPTDINEIANGIVKYIENQDFRNKMIKEGLIISKNFSFEKNIDKLIKIINN